jgi:hypothetical protein
VREEDETKLTAQCLVKVLPAHKQKLHHIARLIGLRGAPTLLRYAGYAILRYAAIHGEENVPMQMQILPKDSPTDGKPGPSVEAGAAAKGLRKRRGKRTPVGKVRQDQPESRSV